jgi:predicted NBD/HSP70 family sugar kinase
MAQTGGRLRAGFESNESGRRPTSRVLSGTNLKFAHQHNQRVILETVRQRGPLSRVEISSHTALSAQTISNIVDQLLDRGVLQTGERRSGRRGQPAVEIDLNPSGGYAVGLHLDRDHMTAVLLDLSGNQLRTIQKEWDFPSPQEALPSLADAVVELYTKQGVNAQEIWGVGLALPGPLDVAAGSMLAPPNFPGWDQIPVRDLLSKQINMPVYLETDATAAAVGERWFGHGRNMHDFFYIFFGVGVGGGMILQGKPYRGAFNTAAMLGHIPVDPNGQRCVCGGRGCLELYISLASLYQTVGVRKSGPESANAIIKCFEDRDPKLISWLETAAVHLTSALVTIENLLNLEAIIFGGRFPSLILDDLLYRVSTRLPDVQMRSLAKHPALLRILTEDRSAALGAATLPLFEAFTPSDSVVSNVYGSEPVGSRIP